MHHRRLIRFALLMWALPLIVGSLAFTGFLFLRSPLFFVSGVVALVVGGLCLTAGVVAVLLVLATPNRYIETPRYPSRKKALGVLGLLLFNLPIALFYTWASAAMLLEPAAVETAVSPSGRYLAELINLDEHAQPPYGQAITLRPKPGLLWAYPRTVVFSSYCVQPQPVWTNDTHLLIRCRDARGIVTRLTRYREVAIGYAFGGQARNRQDSR